MRRFLLAVALVVAVASLAAAQSRDRVVRTFTQTYDPAGHEAVVFELNVGSIEVVGVADGTINAEIRVRCARGRDRERCAERAEDVELNSSERAGKLYLEVEGTGLWRSRDAHVEVTLSVPRELAMEIEIGTGEVTVSDLAANLTLELGVGEATLTNLSGDLTVDMGVGEINVTMPQDAVGVVTLDNGIGETELRHRGGRNAMEGILGGTDVHWDSGTGPHTVKIDLNVGEIMVRLK